MGLTVSNTANIFDPYSVTFEEQNKILKKIEERETREKKQIKNSPFSRWTQFNNEHTKELMLLAMKYPKAHAILYFLVDQMDNYNACVCSYKVIQEVLYCGQATIARNIKILKDLGFIAILKSGKSNIYTINDKVYWKSWGNNRKYSKFPANVILSLSEQEDLQQIHFEDLQKDKTNIISLKKDA